MSEPHIGKEPGRYILYLRITVRPDWVSIDCDYCKRILFTLGETSDVIPELAEIVKDLAVRHYHFERTQ